MREVAAIVATVAVALALVAMAIFWGGDRRTMVPVPEATAETFTREITTRRFDLAMRYLAAGVKRAETARTLESRFDPLFGTAGPINGVDAELGWMQGDRATATATVKGDRASVSFAFELEREHGLWKITGLPDLH